MSLPPKELLANSHVRQFKKFAYKFNKLLSDARQYELNVSNSIILEPGDDSPKASDSSSKVSPA